LAIFLVEIWIATGEQSAEQVIRPAKVIPASHAKPRFTQLLVNIHRLWKFLKREEDWRERRIAG